MRDLTRLSDLELWNEAFRAERQCNIWFDRTFQEVYRSGGCFFWEAEKTPRGQEAHHRHLFWDSIMRRLHVEEDRRGGIIALRERLQGATKEIQRINKALIEFRFSMYRARLLLFLLWLLEKLGSKTAHSVADDCRDVISECRYATEEYEMNLCRVKRISNAKNV